MRVKLCFYLASGEMKEKNLEPLRPNIDILNAGLDVGHIFELKGNLIDYTAWNTGESGDII